jgi:hypothetical protein
MKKFSLFASVILIGFALVPNASAITISASEYGSTISGDEQANIHDGVSPWRPEEGGQWHSFPIEGIRIYMDGGAGNPNYALFDLSPLAVPILGGSLSFDVLRAWSGDESDIPMLLHDVTLVDELTPPLVWPDMQAYLDSARAVYNDLTSGVFYGGFRLPFGSEGTTFDVALNDAATAAINASLGEPFRIGIFLGPDMYEGNDVQLDNLQLHLNPVPEPGTILLLGVGLAAAGGFARKRKRQ